MNPRLDSLHRYPFEKLACLKTTATAPKDKSAIKLCVGEPQHGVPQLITEKLIAHIGGLAKYPTTKGLFELRLAITQWLSKRFELPEDAIHPELNVLPVNGTREALFAFAQSIVDSSDSAIVLMPNPFYQIYEGAALLAGAEPYYLNCDSENHFLPSFDAVSERVWHRCQLIYLCSPGNPTGSVISNADLKNLINLAERYDFVIAADECYSEIYADEHAPPTGLLQAAYGMGNTQFKRCVVFNSLSKRSSAPGLRSGFVAGDKNLLEKYLLYRTYHGCSMPIPFQHASIAAWGDEKHVVLNRKSYREKFSAVVDILNDSLALKMPTGGFFLWPETPIDDELFALQLLSTENISVLPGSYLSRDNDGRNPGKNHVRIALVQTLEECIESAHRIKRYIQSLN